MYVYSVVAMWLRNKAEHFDELVSRAAEGILTIADDYLLREKLFQNYCLIGQRYFKLWKTINYVYQQTRHSDAQPQWSDGTGVNGTMEVDHTLAPCAQQQALNQLRSFTRAFRSPKELHTP